MRVSPQWGMVTRRVEDAIEEGVFKNLISVVRAISSHDERLVEEIRKIKLGKGQHQSQSDHLVVEGTLNLIIIEGMGDLMDRFFDQVVSKIRLPWRSFEEARAYAQTLKLKGREEWVEYCKGGNKPEDIPAYPNEYYKNKGWISLGDWLGKSARMPFEEARVVVRKLNLKNKNEWKDFCKCVKKPKNIPAWPDSAYKGKGWISWGDWLGK